MDKTEILVFSNSEIDEAIDGLDGLQEIMVPLLRKVNHEGMGEQDAQQLKRHMRVIEE